MPNDPQQVQELFLRLARLPPGDRLAMLNQECGSDSELRQRVAALLQAHGEPNSDRDGPSDNLAATLDSGVAAVESAATGVHTPDSSDAGDSRMPQTATTEYRRDAAVGMVIAERYMLHEKIGEGGMGEVWVAQQSEPVKRKVALKLIKTGMDSRSVLQRFEQERQALALMDHPNIARVLDGGMTPTGQPFFVMELVNGMPLNKFCDEARLTPNDRLALFVPICQAVQHAHQKGIVHRDLKPGNILVTLIDSKPVPKVIDFGVAKATEGKITEDTLATGFGNVVGTLEYMSPEQAGVTGEDVDTRADIYSLGVILYELLTGLRPIDAGRLKKAALHEMFRIIQEEEPPRPSTRLSTDEGLPSFAALRQTEPGKLTAMLRGELDWVVMKCLEKQRERRYETANALARDIQRFLADEVVDARPPSAGYRFGKFLQRNKGPVVAASLVLMALVAGISGTTFGMFRAETRRKEAEQARDDEAKARVQAREERDRTNLLNQFLIKDLLTSSDPNQAQGREITVKEVLANAAARLETAFLNRPDLESAMRITLGNTYAALAEYDAAELHLQLASKLCREKLPNSPTLAIEAGNSLARLRILQGRVDEATAMARQNLLDAEQQLGADHQETLTAMDTLGTVLRDQGEVDEAETYLTKALDARRRILGEESRDTLVSAGELALLRQSQGQMIAAEQLLRDALKPQRRIFGSKHPDTLSMMSGLGLVLFEMHKLDEAADLFQECLATRTVVQGPEHPDTLVAMHNLALAFEAQQKLDDSIRLERRCLELSRRIRGEQHPETLVVMGSLGSKLRVVGQLKEAEALLQETVDSQRKVLGEKHPATLVMQANLSSVFRAEGKLVEAESLLLHTKDSFLSIAGPNHPTTLQIHYLWASVLLDQSKLIAARKALEESVAAYRRVFGPEDPNTIDGLATLGSVLIRLGEPAAAEPLLRECLQAHLRALPPGHPKTLDTKILLGDCLLRLSRLAEAESLLRECLAISQKQEPNGWRWFNTQSMLGGALLGQKKYADAEPPLLAGYDGLKLQEAQIPEQVKSSLPQALDRLIELYTATDQSDEVKKWQAERANYPPPEPK